MPRRKLIGISACLFGQNVRYDGGHKLDVMLLDAIGEDIEWVPVCPESECGLPVPREAMRLVSTNSGRRIITVDSWIDQTGRMLPWSAQKLEFLAGVGLRGFVFKSGSPSCGILDTPLYSKDGTVLGASPGLFAGLFMSRFPHVPVQDEKRLRGADELVGFMNRLKLQ